MRIITICLFLIISLFHFDYAQAYIGPGVGAGAISVVLGVLASIFFAFVAILWYPVKRFLKARKKSREKNETNTQEK